MSAKSCEKLISGGVQNLATTQIQVQCRVSTSQIPFNIRQSLRCAIVTQEPHIQFIFLHLLLCMLQVVDCFGDLVFVTIRSPILCTALATRGVHIGLTLVYFVTCIYRMPKILFYVVGVILAGSRLKWTSQNSPSTPGGNTWEFPPRFLPAAGRKKNSA
jgi:hypothetical protein